MLGKLMKYEWKAGWKMIGLMNLFTILMTVLGCLSLGFMNFEDPGVLQIFTLVAVFIFYCLTISAVSIGCTIYVAVRFYKNMYSNEGYLMHTLPVTPRQLLLSKLFIGSGYYIVTTLMVLLSIFALLGVILFRADPFVYSDFAMVMAEFEAEMGMSFMSYMIYCIVLSVFSCAEGILMIYASIALGQLASKHKVLTAIGAYIAITTVIQFVTMIATFGMTWNIDVVETGVMPMGGIFAFSLVLILILGVVFYILTEQLMKRKLNLE